MESRITITSQGTQTEHVSSPILWQALYIIKTVPEFQNLSYRVSQSANGQEVVVVHREGINGVFGPLLDPLTVTIQPSGHCLVNVLFRPVQRVALNNKGSGCIEIAALMAVLRLVSGKGYAFCPGLPERFLAGKECAKVVTVHRIPFKRYQSQRCLVYYQLPPAQRLSPPESLRALCVHCQATARVVQALPTIRPQPKVPPSPLPAASMSPTPARVQPTVQATPYSLPLTTLLPSGVPPASEHSLISHGAATLPTLSNVKISADNTTSTSVPPSPASSSSSSGGNSVMSSSILARQLTKPVPPQPVQILDSFLGVSNVPIGVSDSRKISTFGFSSILQQNIPKGPSTAQTLPVVPTVAGSVQPQAVSESVKHSLREKALGGKKDSFGLSQDGVSVEEATIVQDVEEAVPTPRQRRGVGTQKNTCRICRKQFSSASNLHNHLQRHEGVSGPKHRKKKAKNSSGRLLVKLLQRSRPSQSGHAKNAKNLSGTSLRLLKKCVDDMLIEGQKTSKDEEEEEDVADAGVSTVTTKHIVKKKFSDILGDSSEDTGLKRPGLKRSLSSGSSNSISPMQTLIEVALQHSQASPLTSAPAPPRALESSPGLDSNNEGGPEKKVRKSSRLASKVKDKGAYRSPGPAAVVVGVPAPTPPNAPVIPQESFNLNLLSTVSLQKALRENSAPTSPKAMPSSAPIAILSPLVSNTTPTAYPYPAAPTVAFETVALSKPTTTTSQQHLISPVSSIPMTSSPTVPQNIPMQLLQEAANQYLVGKPTSRPPNSREGALAPIPPLVLASNVMQQGQPVVKQFTEHNPNSECGAIDLSKPKTSHHPPPPHISAVADTVQQSAQPTPVPESVAQYLKLMSVGGNLSPSNNPTQHGAGQNKGPGGSAHPTEVPTLFDKAADLNLQARIFARARDYKLDSGKSGVMQASTTAAAQNSESPALGHGYPDDEIQCGYKWSGSGGLVKERTQMVRELVPYSEVAKYLSGQEPIPQQQAAMMPIVHQLTHHRPQAPTQFAPSPGLNLITGKSPSAPSSGGKRPIRGRPRKTQGHRPPTNVSSSSTLAPHSSTVPRQRGPIIQQLSSINNNTGVFVQTGLLRATLMSPQGKTQSPPSSILVNQLMAAQSSVSRSVEHPTLPEGALRAPPVNAQNAHVMASLKAYLSSNQHQVGGSASKAGTPPSLPRIAPTPPSPSSQCAISSPSLAAILRQPVNSAFSPATNRSPSSEPPQLSPAHGAPPIRSISPVVKNEPVEDQQPPSLNPLCSPPGDSEGMVIMALPRVKKEMPEAESSREGSPDRLVVDMSLKTPAGSEGDSSGMGPEALHKVPTISEQPSTGVKCE